MFIPDQNWQVIPMNNSSPATTACATQQPRVTHNHGEILVQAVVQGVHGADLIAGRAMMEEHQVDAEQACTGPPHARVLEGVNSIKTVAGYGLHF